ncbi:MAG: hypothetical protein IPN27_00090 [Cellvibrionales bacterium]|jgi:hypothetical protein|nr:hypothetical protein [Cellvibrionales bacterium]
MYKKIVCPAVIGVAICISGCASKPVQFTNFEEINGRTFKRLPKQTVSSSSFALFDVIHFGATSREKKIKDALLSRSGADALIDIEISSKHVWVVIGDVSTLRVTAVPIKFVD